MSLSSQTTGSSQCFGQPCNNPLTRRLAIQTRRLNLYRRHILTGRKRAFDSKTIVLATFLQIVAVFLLFISVTYAVTLIYFHQPVWHVASLAVPLADISLVFHCFTRMSLIWPKFISELTVKDLRKSWRKTLSAGQTQMSDPQPKAEKILNVIVLGPFKGSVIVRQCSFI